MQHAEQTETAEHAHAVDRTAEVAVIGGGFAGLALAEELGKAGRDVLVIDRQNHHLFQPLLYQVATAALSSTEIAEPIRKILRRRRSVRVLMGEVSGLDPEARKLWLRSGEEIGFRLLVVASGATHGYFGHDDWAKWAPGLKSLEDARRIRSQILLAFERAERCPDPEEVRRLLSIVIVGGGPTGVELAGSIAELSRHTLARDFRHIDPAQTCITLIEAGPRLLAGFSEEASDFAARRLARLGVTVRTGALVEDVGPEGVTVAGQALPAGAVIWAAGVAASPLARDLGETDRSGRIAVDPTLAVPGHPGIYALGDIAACPGPDGRPLPGLAQVAKQQGQHLGRELVRHLQTGAAPAPFTYHSRGNTAIVGRHAAVFEGRRVRWRGWFAWLGWAVIHVYLLVGFRNRTLVSVQWLWRYLTYERGARLIADDRPDPAAPAEAATPRPPTE